MCIALSKLPVSKLPVSKLPVSKLPVYSFLKQCEAAHLLYQFRFLSTCHVSQYLSCFSVPVMFLSTCHVSQYLSCSTRFLEPPIFLFRQVIKSLWLVLFLRCEPVRFTKQLGLSNPVWISPFHKSLELMTFLKWIIRFYIESSGLTNTRWCRYSCMRSWWWVEVPPETCRAVSK